MKFRILEKSVYNSWYDMWETRYFVQSRLPYVPFWWDTYGNYEYLWKRRETLMGQLAKVKYFDVGNGYTVPRFPIYIGIRHKDDL